MEREQLRALFERVAAGQVSVDDAVVQVGTSSFADLGYAKPDFNRGVRTGVSEVIYGAGKTSEQIAGIASSLVGAGQEHVLVTRVGEEKAAKTLRLIEADKAFEGMESHYHNDARLLTIGGFPRCDGCGFVIVACAGTSDLYCAEEAAITAQMMGSRVYRMYDVGVAGIHRLLAHADKLQRASAVVAVAGMEGALASVIGGLCACPVIACPTSVGYGASLGGISALLAMLNSCSSGTSVVNIDNGFGAGYQAALVDHVRPRSADEENCNDKDTAPSV